MDSASYRILTKDDELMHYGVLGMKWGVWNEETKARYSGKRREAKEKRHSNLVKSRNAKKLYAHRSELSDKELQDRINRLNKEQELKRLAYGQNVGTKILRSIEGMAIASISAYIFNQGKEFVKNAKNLYDVEVNRN